MRDYVSMTQWQKIDWEEWALETARSAWPMYEIGQEGEWLAVNWRNVDKPFFYKKDEIVEPQANEAIFRIPCSFLKNREELTHEILFSALVNFIEKYRRGSDVYKDKLV